MPGSGALHFQINLSFTYFIISPHFPLSYHPKHLSFLPFCLREFLLLYLPPVPGDIPLQQEGCRLYVKLDFRVGSTLKESLYRGRWKEGESPSVENCGLGCEKGRPASSAPNLGTWGPGTHRAADVGFWMGSGRKQLHTSGRRSPSSISPGTSRAHLMFDLALNAGRKPIRWQGPLMETPPCHQPGSPP